MTNISHSFKKNNGEIMRQKVFKIMMAVIIIIPFFQGALMSLFLLSGEITKFLANPKYQFTSIYKIMFDLMMPMTFLVLLTILINLVYLYATDKVPKEKRSFWSGLIVFGNVGAAPFFWYWYIWKKND